MPSARISWVP